MHNSLTIPQFLDPGLCSWELNQQVHVWRFPVREIFSSLLTDPEKEFAGRFRLEEDKNRFTTGRHALRLLLSKYHPGSGDIIFHTDTAGKPRLRDPAAGISFNLSHSGGWVLLAFAKNEIGVDVEKIDPDFIYKDLIEEHFSRAEEKFIRSSANPRAAFYTLWTRKEALTKAWGTGLSENLKGLEVLENSVHEMKGNTWTVNGLSLSDGYPAAIAYQGTTGNIFYFEGAIWMDVRSPKI